MCPKMLQWPLAGSELSARQPVEGCPDEIRVLATVSDVSALGRMRSIWATAPGGRWDLISCGMYAETSPTYRALVEKGLTVGSKVVCSGFPTEHQMGVTKRRVLHLGLSTEVELR
jgi:hypothetical protein